MRVDAMPLYLLADAARAAGVPVDRLSSWVSRGNITPAGPARGTGDQHRFSKDDVLTIAIAYRVWKLGLDPSDAFAVAAAWLEDADGREPGELYPDNKTLLVAIGDREAHIVRCDTVAPFDDQAMIVLDVAKVVAAVEPNLIERRVVPFTFEGKRRRRGAA